MLDVRWHPSFAHSPHVRGRECAMPAIVLGAYAAAAPTLGHASEDIEFVQEHLPEVAMDNRYASLPLWGTRASVDRGSALELQTAFGTTSANSLEIRGPLLSLGARWALDARWQVGAFAFYDALTLKGSREERDLQTLFAPTTPIARPNAAQFSGLDGSATDLGVGLNVAVRSDGGWLGVHDWLAGALWQSVELRDYRFEYIVESGPQTGERGTIDFDARYNHVAPFVGVALPREYGDWTMNAHMLVVYPLPRRGVVGHITGPGFDLRGDTADVGNGKHFGDPSVTFGYAITYRPAHVSLDVGALATQGLLEPKVHRGIERNWLVSLSVAF